MILERIRRGERVKHYETVRCRKDGSHVDVSLTVSPIKNGKGKLIRASTTARDINEQRRNQERLRQSEDRFRVTLSSIGDAVIATDNEVRVTFMNSVAEKLTGWGQRETLGSSLETAFKIINEITREPVENAVGRVLREGSIVGLANQTVLVSKDGTERSIEDSAAPIRDSHGHLSGAVLVFRDATQKRAVKVAARRLALMVDNSDDAIYSEDTNGFVTSWNKGAERFFGYTAQEAIGKRLFH